MLKELAHIIAKFIQGDACLLSRLVAGSVPLVFESVAVGPGPVRFLQKVLQDPAKDEESVVHAQHRLILLELLSDEIVHAITGALTDAPLNAMGSLIQQLFISRATKYDLGTAAIFPSLHDVQVRGCICHMAFYTLDSFIRSTNTPVITTLPLLTAGKALQMWQSCISKKQKTKKANLEQKQRRIKKQMMRNGPGPVPHFQEQVSSSTLHIAANQKHEYAILKTKAMHIHNNSSNQRKHGREALAIYCKTL